MYKTKFRQRLCRNRKILPRILRTKPRREGPSRCGHFLPEHAIPTSFSPDFSGQKWTLRKSSGGQNGWTPELPKKPRSTRAAPTTRFENLTRPQSLGSESPRGILRYLCQGIRRQISDIREHIRNCRKAMFFHSVQNW